jgi:N-acetylmuramoyl-L-alanine amidase
LANSDYLIAGNDEHGLSPLATPGKRTPYIDKVGRSFYENEFNKEAKRYFLEACSNQGFKTLDVKPSNYDVSLTTRAQIVNNNKPNLLVTFAYNAYGDGTSFNSASGFEVYYSTLNVEASKSKSLANDIIYYLKEGTVQTNRGVKTGNYYMLKAVNCPSVIIESGFMTNLIEAKRMMDPDYQREVGEEACKGVCKYLGVNYKASSSLTYPLLKSGSKGDKVKYLQYKLLSRLYNPGTIDGIYGNNTLKAVKEFQKDNGLSVDGIVGNKTWSKLKGVISS